MRFLITLSLCAALCVGAPLHLVAPDPEGMLSSNNDVKARDAQILHWNRDENTKAAKRTAQGSASGSLKKKIRISAGGTIGGPH